MGCDPIAENAGLEHLFIQRPSRLDLMHSLSVYWLCNCSPASTCRLIAHPQPRDYPDKNPISSELINRVALAYPLQHVCEGKFARAT